MDFPRIVGILHFENKLLPVRCSFAGYKNIRLKKKILQILLLINNQESSKTFFERRKYNRGVLTKTAYAKALSTVSFWSSTSSSSVAIGL